MRGDGAGGVVVGRWGVWVGGCAWRDWEGESVRGDVWMEGEGGLSPLRRRREYNISWVAGNVVGGKSF